MEYEHPLLVLSLGQRLGSHPALRDNVLALRVACLLIQTCTSVGSVNRRSMLHYCGVLLTLGQAEAPQ